MYPIDELNDLKWTNYSYDDRTLFSIYLNFILEIRLDLYSAIFLNIKFHCFPNRDMMHKLDSAATRFMSFKT